MRVSAKDKSTEVPNAQIQAANSPRKRSTALAHGKSAPLYIGAGGIATACHYAFVAIAVEFFGVWPLAATVGGFTIRSAVKYWLHYMIAQALTTILLIPPGYILSRRWVFGPRADPP